MAFGTLINSTGGVEAANQVVRTGVDTTYSFAQEVFEFVEKYTDQYIQNAHRLEEGPALPDVSSTIELGDITATIGPFVKPVQPTPSPILPDFPTAPSEPTLGDVSMFALDDVPQYIAPNIKTITAPSKFDKAAPSATVIGTYAYPDTPAKDLPTKVSMRQLVLPTAPSIYDVTFEGLLPEALEPAPNAEFSHQVDVYESSLLSALNNRLLEFVQGIRSTGLTPAVEQQIWDRARERANAEAQRGILSINRLYASAGFDMPQGDQANKLYEAIEKAMDVSVSESRNVAIAQAELEQKNFQFAFSQAIILEGQLMNAHVQTQQLILDAAKTAILMAIDIYKTKIAYFNANVQLYATMAEVYKSRIQAELAKVELYKALLSGQKLISELNAQDIANYKAQIDAVVSLFEVYKAELESVKIRMEGDRLKLMKQETDIKSFSAEISAKTLELDAFKAELSGEQIKAQIEETAASTFAKKIDGFKAVTDAKRAKLDAEVEIYQRVPLEILKQRVEVFQSMTEAEAKRLQSLNETYKTQADVYKAESEAESSRVEAEAKVLEEEIKRVVAEAQVSIDTVKLHLEKYKIQKDYGQEAILNTAKIYAQLIASYVSSLNFSASLSGSGSDNYSFSESNSVTTVIEG